MGLCVECKFHEIVEDSRFERKCGMRHFVPSGHYCNNENNKETDFITGEKTNANCYFKNAFEECLFFESLEEDPVVPPTNDDPDTGDTTDTSGGSTNTGDDTSTGGDSNETQTGTDPDPNEGSDPDQTGTSSTEGNGD